MKTATPAMAANEERAAPMSRSDAIRLAAIFDALPTHIALVDHRGDIVLVNEAWQQFAIANGLSDPGQCVGTSYLAVCERVIGPDLFAACQAATGIREVLSGAATLFSLEYPCDSPTEQRWFLMTATPLVGQCGGVVVMHLNITERKLAEQRLSESQQRFDGMVAAASDAILTADDQSRVVFANAAAQAMFGYDAKEFTALQLDQLVPARLCAVHAPGVEALDHAAVTGLTNSRADSISGLRSNGEEFPLEASVSRHHVGELQLFTMIMRDISGRVRREALLQRLHRVQAMLTGINKLIVHVRDRGELFGEACRILVEQGGMRMALIGLLNAARLRIEPVASVGFGPALLATMRRLLASEVCAPDGRCPFSQAIRDRRPVVSNNPRRDVGPVVGGQLVELGVRSLVTLPLIVAGEAIGVVALYSAAADFFSGDELALLAELTDDIAFGIDHLDKQEALHHLAYYDPLTGLANRSLFMERVAHSLRSTAAASLKLALFVIDVERFRNINASLGRPLGDLLLKQISGWLARNLGDAELIARVGADQFAVVLPNLAPASDVARLIEGALKALSEHPFQLGDSVHRVAAKAGAAVFPGDSGDAEALFRNAEVALKRAKAQGDRCRFYTRAMNAAVAERLALETRLRHALDRDEFVLHYQPKWNLRSGRVAGAEALIRWHDPQRGLVPPGEFIPVLEETGLIREVGRWVMHKALDDHLRWRDAGLAAVRIAVNVSPLQLRDSGFVTDVCEALAADPKAAAGLKLEVTEGVVMEDVRYSVAILKTIREMGVTIAIDDFGTGYSSLSYLSKLPLDALKIDRSFIVDMTAGPEGLALVSTIINLGHSLGLRVVAEGVETEAQSDLLRLLSCDEIQGYLRGRPVGGTEFERLYLRPVAA